MGTHSVYELITTNNYIRAWRHGRGCPTDFGVELAAWVMTVAIDLDAICERVDKVQMVERDEMSTLEARIRLAQYGLLRKDQIGLNLEWEDALLKRNHPDHVLKAQYCMFPIWDDEDYTYTIDFANQWIRVKNHPREWPQTKLTWMFKDLLDMGTIQNLMQEYEDAEDEAYRKWEKEEEERKENKLRKQGRR